MNIKRVLKLVFSGFGCLGFMLIATLCGPLLADAAPSHGLWVWKSATVLAAPQGAQNLLDFCKAQDINEVYVSVSASTEAAETPDLVSLIGMLHGADILVEALLSSTDADEPGKHRQTLLDHVRSIIQFNKNNPTDAFDGIHLDIEPQQRAENKGPGSLSYLPGLGTTFQDVNALAAPAKMTVDADIQTKILKADLKERRKFLTAIPRVTLMMYELSSPGDGETPDQQAAKVAQKSQEYLAMAYEGLTEKHLAKMAIALRTPDYGTLLPQMLQKLDDTNSANAHYLGWARHSYNDILTTSNQ